MRNLRYLLFGIFCIIVFIASILYTKVVGWPSWMIATMIVLLFIAYLCFKEHFGRKS